MAFVFRSELKSCFEVKADPDLGPGYYNKDETESRKQIPNKIPFLSSSPKLKPKKVEEIPGPGAYYSDEQFQKIYKNVNNLLPGVKKEDKNKNDNVNVDVIYRALENENILNEADPIHLFVDEHFEKMGFLSKNKRFKEIKNLEVPGPGAYMREKSKSARILTNKNDKEKLRKNFLASINKNKVESIPSKNNWFGYDYNENGDLVKNNDPFKEKKYLGIKGSSVGPGNYDVVKDKDWFKKGVMHWGKEKSQTQNNFFKREIKNNNKLINKSPIDRSFSPESKSKNLFNHSGTNLNVNYNSNNLNFLDNNTSKNENEIANSGNIKQIKNLKEEGNFHNKTFYALRKNKLKLQKRMFSHKKFSSGYKKNSKFETIENLNNLAANTEANENNVYNKTHFEKFKSTQKRFSQSFEFERKEAEHLKTDTNNLLKYYKEKNRKMKETILMNHTNKLFDRGYLLNSRRIDNNPGPGYYLEEKMYTSFKPQALPEDRQTFGSICQRFPYLKTADSLGPGAYFREEFKMEKIKQKTQKEKTMIPQINKLKSYKPVKVEHNILPGPGQYEPNKPKKRVMTASAAANFGSKEPRFKKNIGTERSKNIGPGSYNNTDYWMNKIENAKNSNGFNSFAKILVKPKSANPYRNINRMNNFELDAEQTGMNFFNENNNYNIKNNEKNSRPQTRMDIRISEVPGVGAYNPDALNSLEYKAAKNCAKNSLVEVPFNCTKSRPRFEEGKSQSVLGPGLYHKNETKKFKQIYPPFKNTEQRFREAKSQYRTNPGQYDTTSYFDWNKKTFNILYL